MEKTQKWHILAVLESGRLMSTSHIRIMLEKDFSLKPKPGALWKMFQRCSCSHGQGLISIEKIGRNNFCRITEKGKRRRKIVAAKKEKEFKNWLDHFFRDEKEKKLQVSQDKQIRSALIKRMIEVKSSLQLCNALVSSIDPNTQNLALVLRKYWQMEELKLIPQIAEEQVKIIEELSEKFARSFQN